MNDGWVDGFARVPIDGRPGLGHRSAIPPRFTIHSTEGTTIGSAVSAYRGGTGCPHFTIDFPTRAAVQHVPVHLGSYALRNDYADGREPNACANVQIEIVGFAKDGDIKSRAELEWIGKILARIAGQMRAIGMINDSFDLVWPEFYDEKSGFTLATKDAKQRDLYKDWNTGRWTVWGHQHIGDGNAHWDPGKINWVLVDAAFEAAYRPGETDMPETDNEVLDRAWRYKINRAIEINSTQAKRITNLINENADQEERLAELEDKLRKLGEALS